MVDKPHIAKRNGAWRVVDISQAAGGHWWEAFMWCACRNMMESLADLGTGQP